MNNIKSIKFSNIDADILYQGGFVKTKDADLKDYIIRDHLYQLEKEIKPLEEREMGVDSGVIPFKGTSRNLEDLIKANRIAYTVLERTIIKNSIPYLIFNSIFFIIFCFSTISLILNLTSTFVLLTPFISISLMANSILLITVSFLCAIEVKKKLK